MEDDSKSAPEQKGKPVQLKIKLDEEMAQGTYCNLVMINHKETEFILDFIFVQPQQPQAKVQSRIVLHPKQAKGLAQALMKNLQGYEGKFGVISTPVQPSAGSTEIH